MAGNDKRPERAEYLKMVNSIVPTPNRASDLSVIRERMLSQFTEELDAKLANLQYDETLTMVFRIEIVGQDGTVRGGRGRNRNMPEYAEWRTAVYERDGYQCIECGATSDLVAHHIKSWAHHPEDRFDRDNGATLCGACHEKKHPFLGMVRRGA